jgi:hypothetical protein
MLVPQDVKACTIEAMAFLLMELMMGKLLDLPL